MRFEKVWLVLACPWSRAAWRTAAGSRTRRGVSQAVVGPDGAQWRTRCRPSGRSSMTMARPGASCMWSTAPATAGRHRRSTSVAWIAGRSRDRLPAKRQGDDTRVLYRIPARRRVLRGAKLKSDISSFTCRDGRRAALLASAPESDALKALKKQGFTQKVYEEDGRWRGREPRRRAGSRGWCRGRQRSRSPGARRATACAAGRAAPTDRRHAGVHPRGSCPPRAACWARWTIRQDLRASWSPMATPAFIPPRQA